MFFCVRPARSKRFGRGIKSSIFLILGTIVLAGCAQNHYIVGDLMRGNVNSTDRLVVDKGFSGLTNGGGESTRRQTTVDISSVPSEKNIYGKERKKKMLGFLDGRKVRIDAIDGLTIKQFANTVFGELLEVPVSIDPELEKRKHRVYMRAVGKVSGKTAVELAQAALQPHGVSISYENAVFTLRPIDKMLSDTPPMIINRADEDTPDDLKPVIQFVKLKAVAPNQVNQLLKSIASKRVKVVALQSDNSVVISGPGKDVKSAVLAVRTIDRPRYAGAKVATITPTYLTSKDFTRGLKDVIENEGYTVSTSGRISGAVNIVSVDAINTAVIFTKNQKLLDRVMYWSDRLDRPAQTGSEKKNFIYVVKNMAAQQIVDIMTGVKSSEAAETKTSGVAKSKSAVIKAVAKTAPARRSISAVDFIIDGHANRVIVRATNAEYANVLPLLKRLDVPPRTVLIEVAIAEVTYSSEAKFGVEWLIDNLKIGGSNVTIGTKGGLGLGSGGFSFSMDGGTLQASLNALAKNNRVELLSTPRIVARSGGTARIEVGNEIPIITSKRNASTTTDGDTDIIQEISYRKTGVILTVKPIIHGDDRVELEIEQELSEASSNPNPAIPSPIIMNRRVVTQLSVADSMTAVVGGLYSDSKTRGDTGVPVLKDMPMVGSLFRSDARERRKTELLIFMRPYIIGGPNEMTALASKLKERFGMGNNQPVVSIDAILNLNDY